jgi:hypothetical protein
MDYQPWTMNKKSIFPRATATITAAPVILIVISRIIVVAPAFVILVVGAPPAGILIIVRIGTIFYTGKVYIFFQF